MSIPPVKNHFKKQINYISRHKLFIIFSVPILAAFFLFIDQSELPDYDAYEKIYNGFLSDEDWEIFFVFINSFFRQSDFSYSTFRNFILILSSTLLWITLLRLPHQAVKATIVQRSTNALITFFILAIFVFEYFVIRIRAGLAISLIYFACISIISINGTYKWAIAIPFFILSFYTHKTTAAILLIFIGIPYIATTIKISEKQINFIFNLSAIIAVGFLLYTLNSEFSSRGEHLTSQLNPIRFIMLSIIPLILRISTKNEASVKIARKSNFNKFPHYFVRFFVFLALGLVLFFSAGLTQNSGEAIVRLYTLSSVPALLSLRISGSIQNAPISAYILTINALFFLVTVLIPS